MELKPGYKLTEVGVIPEDWEVKRLDEIAEIRSGGTPSTGTPDFWDGSIPWCTPTDITALNGCKYIHKTARKITQRGLDSSAAEIIPPRAVVMTSRATIGECAINTVPLATNQGFKNFVPFAQTDTEFLYYLLGTQKQGFIALCGGSTFLEIGKIQLAAYKVIFPALAEQRAIAGALSDVDALLAAQEQLIAKKRDLKQAAMQQLLTGKTRLPGFSGEWKSTTFSSVVRHHAGNSSLIKGKLATTEAAGLFPAYSASGQDVWCERWEYEGDAVVVSAVGSRCGKAFAASGKWSAIANTHVVWPDTKKVDKKFLGYYINDEEFWLKSGTGQPFVLFKQSFLRPLPLPPLPEQTSIAAVLSDMDAEIAALEARRDKTRALKHAMMQELLAGKTRLV